VYGSQLLFYGMAHILVYHKIYQLLFYGMAHILMGCVTKPLSRM